MTEVAVVPFFNRTEGNQPDGRSVARSYANELSKIPGFHVMPQRSVEEAMLSSGLTGFEDLSNVENVRKLGRILGVEAVVIGDIHDYDGFYPPKMRLETKWYAVNRYLHYVPAGYALPWGSKEEEQIPPKLVFLAEHELAREQLKTQTPEDPDMATDEKERLRLEKEKPKKLKLIRKTVQTPNGIQQASVLQEVDAEESGAMDPAETAELRQQVHSHLMLMRSGISNVPDAPQVPQDMVEGALPYPPTEPPLPRFYFGPDQTEWSDRNPHEEILKSMSPQTPYAGQYPGYPPPAGLTPEEMAHYGRIYGVVPPLPAMYPMMPGMSIPGQDSLVVGEPDRFPGLPADWPDPRGFIPDGPSEEKPVGKVSNNGPVMRWVAMFDGNDVEFTQALQDWDFTHRDDRRVVSWQSVLSNQEDFIRFCCRMHIWQMLTARGGAGQAETVRRINKLWFGGTQPY